ncbi:MAG: CocE/NonD family hydrolase [Spirochaetes bacterium]|nr:MAG: CocE/NonD family hydrolase [Spirochaetota bacterium]
MYTYRLSGLVVTAVCLALSLAFLSCANEGAPVSRHLEYSGYSAPAFKGYAKETRLVPMKDGTRLAVDYFIPKDGPAQEKFPSLFVFTPYGRAYLFPKMAWYEKLFARISRGTWGPIFDWSTREDVKLFLSHGYAFVVADMRGAGASFGAQMPFTPGIAEDGKELVDWIGAQPWSNGKVGMYGRSYLGWIQLMIAAKKPKALACIMPEVIVSEAYTEGVKPGGIDAIAWIERYAKLLLDLNLNRFDPANLSIPTAPAADEDVDGDFADEMPLMGAGDPASFLDDGPPVYADGKAREGLYHKATLEHKKNVLFTSFKRKSAPYFDTIAPEVFGPYRVVDGSPGYYLKEVIESGIPVYNIGGWFDGFVRGTAKIHATMAGKTRAKLHLAPRFHYPPYISKAYGKYFDYGVDYEKIITVERLRFFDRYLKGIENGIDREAPVNIYVMNAGWRSENEWPPARGRVTPFYFGEGRALAEAPGADGADRYDVDFTHSSSYGKNEVNRWLMMYVPDGLMERTGQDAKCLTWDTPALDRDMEVTGHPVVSLYVSSNRDDGDFFVYLSDVDESGKSLYVTEGQLRAGWKNMYNDDDQVLGKIDVKPDLPWHGYKKDQYSAKPLAGGKITELRFDLLPTSWLFKKGHRVRVAVACADDKNFEMNPYLCSGDRPEDCPATTVTVHRAKAYPSRIELPVIPAR